MHYFNIFLPSAGRFAKWYFLLWFSDQHICIFTSCPLGCWWTRTEMVLETLIFLPFNQLTWLVAWEYFIIQSCSEGYKPYRGCFIFHHENIKLLGINVCYGLHQQWILNRQQQ
jgi:hypothetical protein